MNVQVISTQSIRREHGEVRLGPTEEVLDEHPCHGVVVIEQQHEHRVVVMSCIRCQHRRREIPENAITKNIVIGHDDGVRVGGEDGARVIRYVGVTAREWPINVNWVTPPIYHHEVTDIVLVVVPVVELPLIVLGSADTNFDDVEHVHGAGEHVVKYPVSSPLMILRRVWAWISDVCAIETVYNNTADVQNVPLHRRVALLEYDTECIAAITCHEQEPSEDSMIRRYGTLSLPMLVGGACYQMLCGPCHVVFDWHPDILPEDLWSDAGVPFEGIVVTQ